MRDRELHEEQEKSKKYTGPVGKNPWGAIAEVCTYKYLDQINLIINSELS